MRKLFLITGITLAIIGIYAFEGDDDHMSEEETIASYEQHPPIAKNYWIRKLAEPVNGNNIIMRIEYEDEGVTMPSTLDIHHNGNAITTFHDDGQAPDITSHDRIYAAYITEDIDAFTEKLHALENSIKSRGGYIKYDGFAATHIPVDLDMSLFDFSGFDSGEEVPLAAAILNGANCTNDLKKENSLFITDLSVIEDQARTYNIVTHDGNKYGLYTFGNLMRNLANTSTPGGVRTFMKNWLKNWISTQQLSNGATVGPRNAEPHLFAYLINPWIQRSRNNPALTTITSSNWETYWDGTDEDSLIVNAPFRLEAIVNRLDTRGNAAYTGVVSNAGETRFIFTLISPYTRTWADAGMPPSDAGNANTVGIDAVDWTGMNVIFEYQNIQTTPCDVKDFAQQWYDLSSYPLPNDGVTANTDLNDALAAITSPVISANAVPGKPNGSALGRIRTNERILFNAAASATASSTWSASNWELRQFEINASSHQLVEVPVTNTPSAAANWPANDDNNLPIATTEQEALYNWMWSPLNKARVRRGVHSLPANMLAGAANIDYEQVHYWDVFWWDANNGYAPKAEATDPDVNNMRRQISLNTCQGCHSGETKTIFTQVYPRGYGQMARYWTTVPDAIIGNVDARFNENVGYTQLPGEPNAVLNYQTTGLPAHSIPIVSSFLTGRAYNGSTYQDDQADANEDGTDAGITGLFYVNDPANHTDNSRYYTGAPATQRRWGYNDLQRRFDDLCHILNHSCDPGSEVLSVLNNTNFQALAMEAP